MFTNSYNPQRQLLFVRRQLALFQQPWLIAAGVVFGLLLIISILAAIYNPQQLYEIQGLYLAALLIGGLIFTSQIFKELHSPHRSYFFLTLPASTLEKLAGAWLLTSPIYILGFTLISFIIFLISFLIGGIPFSLSYFFNEELGGTITSYMVTQTIFLWGAVYFRKNNFLKTVLTLIGFILCLAAYVGLLVWLNFIAGGKMLITSEEVSPQFENIITLTSEIFSYAIFGPYMLLMSYFTLKERQV